MHTLSAEYCQGIDEIKPLNPTAQVYLYRLDQSYFNVDEYRDSHGIHAAMEAYASFHNLDLEDAFLHFSEDSTYTTVQGQESVPGCIDGIKTKACRVRSSIWTQPRWIINPKSDFSRSFFAHTWNQLMTAPSAGGLFFDGILLDEHGPGLPGLGCGDGARSNPDECDSSAAIQIGGGLLEYNGMSWRQTEFAPTYHADFNGFLQAQRSLMNQSDKRLLINSAEYCCENIAMVNQTIASDGASFEFMLDPNKPRSTIVGMWEAGNAFMGAGKIVISYTRQKRSTQPVDYYPGGYTSGNYASPGNRARIVELAMYYLGKDAGNAQAYFGILGGWGLPFTETYTYAQEIDIGRPVDGAGYYRIATGDDGNGSAYEVFARDFEKALVLLRPKDAWNYNSFGDSSTVTISLSGTMTPIGADGQEMAPTQQVVLRNSEAAILLKN